jgi:hypothetical protein
MSYPDLVTNGLIPQGHIAGKCCRVFAALTAPADTILQEQL